MPSPDDDIAAALATALGGGYAVGTNIFRSPVRPSTLTPAISIFCAVQPGGQPGAILGGGYVTTYEVQVRVRGEQKKYDAAKELAKTCSDALHGATVSGYWRCHVREAHPGYIGEDEQGLPGFAFNVEISRRS